MGLSTLLTALKTPNMLATNQLMKELQSLMRIHFLHAALDAGLLGALSQPRTTEQLQEALDIDRPELLEALLDLGRSLGEIGLSDGCYRLKGRLSKVLADPANDPMAAMIQGQVTYYNKLFRQLGERMRGGELSDELHRIGKLVARISALTEPFMVDFLGRLVADRGAVRILDVGCGSGAHLRRCAEMNPQACGRGLDLDEHVVREAQHNLKRWGIDDRFSVSQADIRQPPAELEEAFDLITLTSMVYYFPLQQRTGLFRALRERLASGGTLAVATTVQGAGRDPWAATLDAGVRSMVGCAPLPKLDQLCHQLREAGFAQPATSRLIPGSSFYGLVARSPKAA